MPYIKRSRRSSSPPDTPGELNFAITKMILDYLGDTPGYTEYNAVIGVLECAKLELYRRKIIPYENSKLEENGDVY